MKIKRSFFLFFVLLCLSLVGCAGENEPKEKSPEKVVTPREEVKAGEEEREPKEESRPGKEIFVDSSLTAYRVLWCGKKNSLVYDKDEGLFVYDVESGLKVRVGGAYLSPLGCSPDGEWLVYEDRLINRFDDDNIEQRNLFLWRYELKTGKRQKFLIADDVYTSGVDGAIFAPVDNTIYLANKPATTMEMPEPKWEVVWLERNTIGKAWLKEPLALVGSGKSMSHSGPMIEIDVLSPYKKKIELDSGFNHPFLIMTDAQDRVYMRDDKRIVRCSFDLDNEVISCGSVFLGDIIAETNSSFGFDITNDGNFVVFSKWRDSCVRIRRIGESKGRCITSTDHKVDTDVDISPDGKWLAYKTFDGLYITEFTID